MGKFTNSSRHWSFQQMAAKRNLATPIWMKKIRVLSLALHNVPIAISNKPALVLTATTSKKQAPSIAPTVFICHCKLRLPKPSLFCSASYWIFCQHCMTPSDDTYPQIRLAVICQHQQNQDALRSIAALVRSGGEIQQGAQNGRRLVQKQQYGMINKSPLTMRFMPNDASLQNLVISTTETSVF